MSISFELRFGLLDRPGGEDSVALLPQNRRAHDQVVLAIIEQKHSDRGARAAVAIVFDYSRLFFVHAFVSFSWTALVNCAG